MNLNSGLAVAAMIAAIVVSATAGDVLIAAAMRGIGDLDDIRAEPGQRDATMGTSVDALLRADGNRVIEHTQSVHDLRLRGYASDRAMVVILAIVIGCLLVVTGVLELMLPAGKLTTFGGSFIVDDFARFLKIVSLIGSVTTLVLSREFLADPSGRIFEYPILVLLSTLGMMVLISAGDLISLYL